MLSTTPTYFKVVVIGDSGVGKTSLIHQFVYNRFEMEIYGTIGMDFLPKQVEVNRNTYTLQIWDMAGNERYGYERILFRGASCFILMFDVTDSTTFNNLVDCVERREICEEVARRWCESHNFPYFETSAKTSHNITDLFISLTNEMVLNNTKSNDNDHTPVVNVQNPSQNDDNGNYCYK
ncbi:Ras-related protein Rab-7b [Entamoeba marina]